jgi:hypothetical protein
MVDFPQATTVVSDQAAAASRGLDVCCVIAPVARNPDITPRLYSAAAAIYEQHGYSEGLEYSALHFDGNGQPILFVAVPISVPGTIGRHDTSGNSGTSGSTVAVGSYGSLTEHDGALRVLNGGLVGTDQIVLELSLDGGFKWNPIRFGTGTNYTEPYAGFSIVLLPGMLVEGDVIHTWHGTSPRASTDAIALAWGALAEGQDFFRTAVQIGDVQNATEAAAILDEVDAYETLHERFTIARCSVPDRQPTAVMSRVIARMAGNPILTFANAGSTDTITRDAGSWIADGFVVGDVITVEDTLQNNVTGPVSAITATVLTMTAATSLQTEASAFATVTGSPGLTFAEVGTSGDTLTRSRGSWVTDGFVVGDNVTIIGTAANNISGPVTAVSALALTFGTTDLNPEVIGARSVAVTNAKTKAAWASEIVDEFEVIDDAPRISLSLGRARKASPFSGWNYRRPSGWAASIREYQHDVHVAPWRKNDGPVGWDLRGLDKKLAEWDDRVDGNVACKNRFTALRTWANGPQGAYIALSLTRAVDSSLRVMTHNMNVVNLVQQLTQTATEDALIGVSLDLNDDGTATEADLAVIAGRVNASYDLEVLANKKNEGKRASSCIWAPNKTDILNVPDATVTGVTELNLNGTVLKVNTTVRIKSGGQ